MNAIQFICEILNINMEYPLDQTIQVKSNKFTKLGKFIPTLDLKK